MLKKIERDFAKRLVGKTLEVSVSDGFNGERVNSRRFVIRNISISEYDTVRIYGGGQLDIDGELLSIRHTIGLIDSEHFAYCEPVDGVERVHHYDIVGKQ